MDDIRIIKQSSENGELEYVRFIDDPDDIKRPADYFTENNCTIDSDETTPYLDWMDTFPMNYTLKRI